MIEYLIATEKDYKDINNFYNRLHNSNRTIEQFRWEFHDGPVMNGIYIIAKDTEKNIVIGSQAVIPINLITADGTIILSGKSEDTLVDPNYRGKRIFNNMYEKLFEECTKTGINYIWGFTTAKKPFLKMDFEIPWSHSQTLIVNNPIESYKYLASLNKNNTLIDKTKILGLSMVSKLKGFSLKAISKNSGYEIKEEKALNVLDLTKEVIQKNGDDSFGIYQDEAYQKWRFYNNPNLETIDSFTITHNGRLVGTFISNTNKEKIAYIAQCLLSPSLSPEAKKEFISYCTLQLYNNGVHLIRNWNFIHTPINNQEIKDFEASGYIHLERGVPFVWKTQIDKGLSVSNFVISRIASEGTI